MVSTCAGERTSVTGRHRSLSTTTSLTLNSDSTKSTRDTTTLGLVTATTSCQQYAPCLALTTMNKNSSGDEIANVNFFTQCARKLPEVAEITQNNGHYAVQGNSRSLIVVPYPSCLTPPAEGFPWDDLREIFSGCPRMAMVGLPNAVEILPKISTA